MLEGERVIETDVLVVGTGLAGLRAAIEARRYGVDVLLVDKMEPGRVSNTAISGGGFKHFHHRQPSDTARRYVTFNDHFKHMVEYGDFLPNQKLAEILTLEANPRVVELEEFSAEIDAHTPGPKRGGQRVTLPMTEYVKEHGVHILRDTFLTDLVRAGDAVAGAVGFNVFGGDFIVVKSKSTVLATGGAGEIYSRNNTAVNVVGDGYEMAYNAGASLVDMEMVMPDAILLAEPGLHWGVHIGGSPFRMRGVLRNAAGEPFETKYLEEHNLVGPEATFSLDDPWPVRYDVHPYDVREHRARAMVLEVREGRGDKGAVLMDFTKVPREEWTRDQLSRGTLQLLRGFPIDERPVHVLPGMICTLGGIRIDENGGSDVPGLYAAGEVTGGVHGAGRLGGNALSDCIVFGARAGRSAAIRAKSIKMPDIDPAQVDEKRGRVREISRREPSEEGDVEAVTAEFKSLMWEHVGVVRSGQDLEAALAGIDRIRRENLPHLYVRNPRELMRALELVKMVSVGEMIARPALMREDSRTCHYRIDHPERDNRNWLKNILLRREDGKMRLWTEPVVVTRIQPPED